MGEERNDGESEAEGLGAVWPGNAGELITTVEGVAATKVEVRS